MKAFSSVSDKDMAELVELANRIMEIINPPTPQDHRCFACGAAEGIEGNGFTRRMRYIHRHGKKIPMCSPCMYGFNKFRDSKYILDESPIDAPSDLCLSHYLAYKINKHARLRTKSTA